MTSKLLCWLWGHQRGKRDLTAHVLRPGHVAYRCPRCGAGWTRKVRGGPR